MNLLCTRYVHGTPFYMCPEIVFMPFFYVSENYFLPFLYVSEKHFSPVIHLFSYLVNYIKKCICIDCRGSCSRYKPFYSPLVFMVFMLGTPLSIALFFYSFMFIHSLNSLAAAGSPLLAFLANPSRIRCRAIFLSLVSKFRSTFGIGFSKTSLTVFKMLSCDISLSCICTNLPDSCIQFCCDVICTRYFIISCSF